jgi:hypothetical protein
MSVGEKERNLEKDISPGQRGLKVDMSASQDKTAISTVAYLHHTSTVTSKHAPAIMQK